MISKFPKLGIIIPTKDNFEYLKQCLESLMLCKYINRCKIYVADTGSAAYAIDDTEKLLQSLSETYNFEWKLINYEYYHFSKINNDVVKNHIDGDTELLLFCNDDIKLINDAISLMVEVYLKNKKQVGTIGCRLHYGDNSVQHGGIMLYKQQGNNRVGLTHIGIKSYYRASHKTQTVFGNTGALMLIKKTVFDNIGGFVENTLECFEDVVLNIQCINAAKKNIYVGEAVAYHYESTSRNKDPNKHNKQVVDFKNVFMPHFNKSINKIKKFISVA